MGQGGRKGIAPRVVGELCNCRSVRGVVCLHVYWWWKKEAGGGWQQVTFDGVMEWTAMGG